MNNQERAHQFIMKRLRAVQEECGGAVRTSNSGVPHLIIHIGWKLFSVTYYKKTHSYTLYSDYGTPNNRELQRFAAQNLTHIVKYIHKIYETHDHQMEDEWGANGYQSPKPLPA